MNRHDAPETRIEAAAYQLAFMDEWDRQFAALPENVRLNVQDFPEGDEAAELFASVEATISKKNR